MHVDAGFQPTRPLRGATGGFFCAVFRQDGFQPTRPLRGATLTFSQPSQG